MISFKLKNESGLSIVFVLIKAFVCSYSFPTGGNIFPLLEKLMLSAGKTIVFPLPET